MKKMLRAGLAIATGCGLMAAIAPSAEASSVKSYTVYSSDNGARGVTKVTWTSATRLSVSSTQCDVKKDGNAPYDSIIFYYTILTGPGANGQLVSKRLSSGYGTCNSASASENQGIVIDYVELMECNGSNFFGETNCDWIDVHNPYS